MRAGIAVAVVILVIAATPAFVLAFYSSHAPGVTLCVQTRNPEADINHDLKIDILDIAVIAFAYDSTPTSERWNPAADIVRDGKITILDVALAAFNFGGRVCP